MALPIRELPVVQNWDCHASGACCRQGYIVSLTEEEKERIEEQNWQVAELGVSSPFARKGALWNRGWQLRQRADGTCVFLGDNGRCRIHERFGYDAKPLPCRLFPFVLVPAGPQWRVSIRYACPSAAANKGRSLAEQGPELSAFAAELVRTAGLAPGPDGALTAPPSVESAPGLPWPELLSVVDTLMVLLRNRSDPLERRLRKCLAFAKEMQLTYVRNVRGEQFADLLKVLRNNIDRATPANLMTLPAPGWIGRVLFRQAVAVFTRKDNGPNRGPDGRSMLGRLLAAVQFARGTGRVPRMQALLPETTFAELERPRGPMPLEAEAVLERYYAIKVASLQFCGPAAFGLPFWEGLETLLLTFPVTLWVARALRHLPPTESVERALTIVDDHFGFNRMLASTRQRASFRILSATGELARLIGWYSR